jgi:polyribonucleotide nucleotidyltransferase
MYRTLSKRRQVIVKITLLAAGFVIGPSGKTIREIGKRSGAEIKSWTAQSGGASFSRRPLRVFLIASSNDACRKVLEIMSDAVDYYKVNSCASICTDCYLYRDTVVLLFCLI